MKTLGIIAALMTMTSTAAFAGNFTGPRAEVTVGVDDVTKGVDYNDVSYGVALGYDTNVLDRVSLGAEVATDNVFDRRDLSVSGRLGYHLNDNVLVFTKAGYANWKQTNKVELEGFRVGAGLETNLVGPVYGKIEYRYTDFQRNVKHHSANAGVGIRF